MCRNPPPPCTTHAQWGPGRDKILNVKYLYSFFISELCRATTTTKNPVVQAFVAHLIFLILKYLRFNHYAWDRNGVITVINAHLTFLIFRLNKTKKNMNTPELWILEKSEYIYIKKTYLCYILMLNIFYMYNKICTHISSNTVDTCLVMFHWQIYNGQL